MYLENSIVVSKSLIPTKYIGRCIHTANIFPWLTFKLIIIMIWQKSASWPVITKVVLNTWPVWYDV